MAYNYLETLIRPYQKSLNKTESIIATHMIALGNDVVNKTLANLSEETGLSEATIFKFVKKIGFSGFQNFKISVASNFRTFEERSNEMIVFSDISESDSPFVIAQKLVNTNIELLENLIGTLDEELLESAIELINSSDTINFFGQGASSIVAYDSYHKFLRTKFHCQYTQDYHIQLTYATKLGPNDCAILFSHSGNTKETIEVARILYENGVKIIVLTGDPSSDLVKLSSAAFVVLSKESAFRSETLTSRLVYLTIIDIIYTAVMYDDEQQNRKALLDIRRALSVTRYREDLP
ncbi:MurR/RpiR family transcriptional regulator [Fundicoccus sp. Sow4_F4]|uniref:MurR/RpiR family transcriptional regulator n=1 Tax=Fundicoccus sp. Sow4_F4 TaxID=3438783 RepID=UPI003F9271CD